MNSRTLANALLLLVLLGFIGFYISTKNKTLDIQRLTSLSLIEINRIQIPRNDKTDIILHKNTSVAGEAIWHMVKPYTIKAHQFRVNTLLGLSQTPINESYNINTLRLQDYALDKPRARIIFNSSEISFGKNNPLNNKRYLKIDNKLALVNDEIYPLVSAQAATFVDLRLLPDKQISALTLPDIKIQKTDTAHWKSASKTITNNALSADQIQTLLDNWRSAQAFAVHRYMPRKKLGMIKITFDTGDINFKLTDDDPWLILARPDLGIEYHLHSSLKQQLFGPFSSNAQPIDEVPSQVEPSGVDDA